MFRNLSLKIHICWPWLWTLERTCPFPCLFSFTYFSSSFCDCVEFFLHCNSACPLPFIPIQSIIQHHMGSIQLKSTRIEREPILLLYCSLRLIILFLCHFFLQWTHSFMWRWQFHLCWFSLRSSSLLNSGEMFQHSSACTILSYIPWDSLLPCVCVCEWQNSQCVIMGSHNRFPQTFSEGFCCSVSVPCRTVKKMSSMDIQTLQILTVWTSCSVLLCWFN